MRPVLSSVAQRLGLGRGKQYTQASGGASAGADIHNDARDYSNVAPGSMRPPGLQEEADRGIIAMPQFTPAQYGDVQTLVFVFAVAGDQLVLPRPAHAQRALLIIINDFAAGIVRINFDNAASATVGIPLAVGANAFFDSFVPQNDIHIFGPGAGAVQVIYANLDITNSAEFLRLS